MKRGVTALISVAVLLIVPVVAGADEVIVEDDANDGFPDLVAASHGHEGHFFGQETVLVHKMAFAEPPEPGELEFAQLLIWLDDDDRKPDRSVGISYYPDNSFSAIVVGRRGIRAHANVFWADERTLQIEFTELALKKGLESYKWRAAVFLSCPPAEVGDCPQDPPEDWVPSLTGKIRHKL